MWSCAPPDRAEDRAQWGIQPQGCDPMVLYLQWNSTDFDLLPLHALWNCIQTGIIAIPIRDRGQSLKIILQLTDLYNKERIGSRFSTKLLLNILSECSRHTVSDGKEHLDGTDIWVTRGIIICGIHLNLFHFIPFLPGKTNSDVALPKLRAAKMKEGIDV